MSEEVHDHHVPEKADYAHHARKYVIPLAAIASALTVLHDRGMAFTIGAVSAWLLLIACAAMSAMHDWKACSSCTTAPRAWNTLAKRARIARRIHNSMWKLLLRVYVLVIVYHALLPKPYMDPWWAKVTAAGLYFLLAVLLASDLTALSQHKHQYQDECHIEWCRAGLKRAPKPTFRLRRQLWGGHHGVWLIAILAPTTCALGVLSMIHPHMELRVAYAFTLVLLVSTVLNITATHTNEVCLRCARHLPDKPEEAAEKRHFWLGLFHKTRAVVLTFATLAMIVSWVLAGTLTAKVLVCAVGLAVLYWAVLDRIHSPVKPWCPWCKDDGGEDSPADVPDPTTNVPSPA